MPLIYQFLANLVLTLHTAFVAFVVLGMVTILLGGPRGWRWVRNPWFRMTHLATIVLVVIQAWLNLPCSLTLLENYLRLQGDQNPYPPGGFIAYWLSRTVNYDIEPWVFVAGYMAFGGLVVLGLWLVPVRWRRSSADTPAEQTSRLLRDPSSRS